MAMGISGLYHGTLGDRMARGEVMYTPPCDGCHKTFALPPHSDEPIMVGFELEDGTTKNYCYSCLRQMAEEKERGAEDGE